MSQSLRSTLSPDMTTDFEALQYYALTGSVGVVLIMVIIVLGCLAYRRKCRTAGADANLSEVYSCAADSLAMRSVRSEKQNSTNYATPIDALTERKAQFRASVISDEYDVLSDKAKPRSSARDHINLYNHVHLKHSNNENDVDSTYDVTSYTKDKANPTQTSGRSDTYSHFIIR